MEEYSRVLDRLQAQCSKREYCSSDIFRKAMKAFDGDREMAGKILQSLQDDRFVDDFRYAAAFAREKSRLTGWGPAKITYTLVGKGIPRPVVVEALGEVDQEEAAKRMRSVLEAKTKTLIGDPQIKFKLLKFGLTRGYEYDQVAPAVDDILKSFVFKDTDS
ncbi:MAG: RecX family transcriptional regulator [Bacteroidales bacterium]|nr:RecX family transcriptional regulator [Bacteroidales bacterium]